ncbi:MAG: glycosyltransferase family 2 protein [Clostridia bacterium]|nr:glycosyltransferase family 2 protein [Clostridia bacterium]
MREVFVLELQQETLKFSIIVPVYKVEAYIRTCLESLLSQTYHNMEIILVDDGSPDACGAICDQYASTDDRIKVIHKANGGLVSARKAGAAVCTGDYVLNVDSDDYISHDLLSELARIIEQHHPDVITFDGYAFSEHQKRPLGGTVPTGFYQGAEMDRIRSVLIHDQNYEVAVVYGIVFAAVRRELYLQHQQIVPDFIRVGEDLAVTGPLFVACDSVYVSDLRGYFYRNAPQSIMHTFRVDEIQQILYVSQHLAANMPSSYQTKIDGYVMLRYVDFLDRGIYLKSYKEYKQLVRDTAYPEIIHSIQRVSCQRGKFMRKFAFYLVRNGYYNLFWLLRKIKKRKGI